MAIIGNIHEYTLFSDKPKCFQMFPGTEAEKVHAAALAARVPAGSQGRRVNIRHMRW